MPNEITPEILSEIAADYDDWATTLEALGDRYAADAKGRELIQVGRRGRVFRAKAADLRRCRDEMDRPAEDQTT